MKKTIFYFSVSLMTVGFAGGMTPAHAAYLPPQPETDMQAQSTVILKQSLDILGSLLTQIENRLHQPDQPIMDKVELNQTLNSIQADLAGIHASLSDYNDLTAGRTPEINPQTAAAPPLVQHEIQQPTAVQPQTANPDSAPLPPTIVLSPRGSVNIPYADLEKTDYVPQPNVAAVSLSSNWNNLLWPSVSLIAVLALIFFLRIREKKEESSENPTSPSASEIIPLAAASSESTTMEEAPIIY